MQRTLVILAFALVACSGERGAPSAMVRDSAGIRIVEHAAPDWLRAPWTLPDSPAVSIGTVDGEEPYQLFRVSGAVRATDGRILVLDAGSGEVRVYDETGRYLSAMGRTGGGPGEFRYPVKVALLPGDSVVVWDAQPGPRVTFAPDGTPVRTETIDREQLQETLGLDRATEDVRPLPNGAFIAASWERNSEARPPDELYRPPFELMLIAPDFSSAVALGTYGGIEQMFVEEGGRPRPTTVLFSAHYQIASGGSPLLIAVGNGDSYEVHLRAADGNLRTIVRRTAPSPPVTPADRDSALAARFAWADQQDRRPEAERLTAALPEQQTFPAHGSLALDTGGNLWVQEYPRPTDTFDRWTVYEANGDLAGWLRTPRGIRLAEIGDDYILAIERDVNDVERVSLYPLRKSRNR
jgi:hypothetical protein